jgi:hypothetical protein
MTEATLFAARSLAQAELSRLVDAVIADLCQIPASGIFPDTACRHFWDELTFDQQEGPYDDVSEAIEDTLHPILMSHITALPPPMLSLLSAHAAEEDGLPDGDLSPGIPWPNGIADLLARDLRHRAARRTIWHLGADRADHIQSELEGKGLVWETLGSEARDLAAAHVGDLLDLDADLTDLADALVKAWLDRADGEARHTFFEDLFQTHWDRLADMLREDDVLPALTAMRTRLLARLDTQ